MRTLTKFMLCFIALALIAALFLSPVITTAAINAKVRIAPENKVSAMLPSFDEPKANQAVIFQDDLEGGAPGWTAEGFWHLVTNPQNIAVLHSGGVAPDDSPNDINPDLVTLPDLDIDGNAWLPSAHSGSHVFWYGVDDNGTFIDDPFNLDIQTAKNGGNSTAANEGSVTTPTIDLTAVAEASLGFWTWWEIEGVDAHAFDMMYIQVSVDGGEFQTIGQLNPINDVDNLPEQNYSSGGSFAPPIWINPQFDLSQFAGYQIQVRFLFQTVDELYNGFRGWMFDDITVIAQGLLAPVITDVSPACVVLNEVGTTIVNIFGENFAAGADVTIGGILASQVAVIDVSKIQIILPALGLGNYDITVTNPDGKNGTLANAITIAESCGDPDIAVFPTSLEQSGNGELTVIIENTGGADLVVSNICDEEVILPTVARFQLPDLEGIRYPTFRETMKALRLKNNPINLEAQGDVLKQCSSPAASFIMGVHYVPSQDVLYVVSEDDTGTIYKMDENCNVTGTLPGPSPSMNGVAFDGQYLWVTDYHGQDGTSDMLYKVDPDSGAVINSCDLMPQGTDGILGIAWDGQNLWVSSVWNSTIFKLNTDCNIVGSFLVSWLSTGLAWDGQYLISSDDDGVIYRVDLNGNVVDSMPAPGGGSAFGVTCGGTPGQLWHSNYTTETLYLVECDWCSVVPCACDPDAPWMSVSPTIAPLTLVPGEKEAVTVTFDGTGLDAGTYYGNIKITSNDPDEGCVVVPVTFSPDVCPTPGCDEDDSGALDIVRSAGGPGGIVTIPVRIQSAPNDVGSLGFEVTFNPCVMEFTGFDRGALVNDFDFFNCVVPAGENNIVRCGGFKSTGGIAAGSNGDVVYLNFNVIDCVQGEKYPLGLQELKDDIAAWTTSLGCFTCGCSCDVNGDGEVTPQDALCAFQTYLGICPTVCGPCEEICCDVTQDADCTPADALEIFREYLGIVPNACSP